MRRQKSIVRNSIAVLTLLSAFSTILSCSKSSQATGPGVDTPAGPVDNNLVADWKQSYASTIEISTGPGGNNSIPSGEQVDFILRADGTYTQQYYNQSSSGCTIIVYGEKTGAWHVDNTQTLYLDEKSYYLKTTDDCNPAYNSEKHPALRKIKYTYRFVTDAYGAVNLYLGTNSGDDIFYR